MCITTFGSRQGEECYCDVVMMALHAVDGRLVKLHIYVVPLICEPLLTKVLTSLNLSISTCLIISRQVLLIDILIGLDQYWDIAMGSVLRDKKGPSAMCTRLGWVLSGPTDSVSEATVSANIVTSQILIVDAMFPVEEDSVNHTSSQ